MKNIKPGMFIKHGGCSIYFEVETVFHDMVVCVSRNPNDKTELVFINQITECVEKPCCKTWIKLNREKGFYDKFYPEGWLREITQVVPFLSLKENDEVIGTKGLMKLVKKVSKGKWKTTGAQKTLSGIDRHFWLLVQRETKPVYN